MATKGEHASADARNQVFEEFFQDYYTRRHQIYWMNFVRGIWFALGAFIGGTVVLAVILWVLSLVHQVPFLSGVIEAIQHSIESAKH